MENNLENEVKEQKESKIKNAFMKIGAFFKLLPSKFVGFLKSSPSKIGNGFKSFWGFLKKIGSGIKSLFVKAKNLIYKLSQSVKSLFEKGKVFLMKLWKKLLPLIVVVVMLFPFVSGFVAAEKPASNQVYSMAPSRQEVMADLADEPEPEEPVFEVSPEAMPWVIGAALAILAQLYKKNKVNKGQAAPGSELINWGILIAGSFLLWYGESMLGLDLKGLASEFPQFNVDVSVRGLFELLADLLGDGASVLGPAVGVYSLFKRTIFEWLGFLKIES